MAQYIVRVELAGTPGYLVYSQLHTLMGAQHFKRTITDSQGKEHDLPSAMYTVVTPATADQVRRSAESCVAALKQIGAQVLVMQISEWASSGLKPVQQARTLSGLLSR